MEVSLLKSLFKTHKESSLFGRYLHNTTISKWLDKNGSKIKIDTLGNSVEGREIISITIGKGSKKILMWSQMHGNESTTTKAIFDLLNVLFVQNDTSKAILKACQIKIIPILNPDGAFAYTRVNANKVDLNRDAQDLSQPESQILRQVFDSFKPDFCFNLHGQRTIFGAGKTGKSASVSFLSPAEDEERSITLVRKKAMSIIVEMNNVLQKQIPDQVGIYDDQFNINCVGDTFQSLQVPTILFEAGHIANDYNREITREFIFQSLIIGLDIISKSEITGDSFNEYLEIPQNEKNFSDIIIRNSSEGDIAIQFEERLSGGHIAFVPIIHKIGDLNLFFGHREIDANGYQIFSETGNPIHEETEIVFVIVNNEKITIKPKNN